MKSATPEELKEILAIKDFGVEISLEEAEEIREYKFLKNPEIPELVKRFMANEEGGGKLGLEQAKVIRDYMESVLNSRIK